MKKGQIKLVFLIVVLLGLLPGSALAQTYSFSLDREIVHVLWNEDGSLSIDYQFFFSNDPTASPLDFVDVGVPNANYDLASVSADVNGNPVYDIEASPYVSPGVAVGLGSYAILPGESGQVNVFIGRVERVLQPDSDDSNYASAVFSPTWFGSEYVHSTTDLTVSFHMPPGVKPEEPRWHSAPAGFPETPETSIDGEGRVTYTWHNPQARGDRQYLFGASFPSSYVPAATIQRPSIREKIGIDPGALVGIALCSGFGGLIIAIIALSMRSTNKRKLQYMPPKVAIEGHGIKRGLTAVEAALLLEQPLDKVLTMILFAVIKKGAAEVIKREPLELKVADPLPEDLRPYESQFLAAFKNTKPAERTRQLGDMMIELVKEVSAKMKGFSRKESQTYYQDIIARAWAQVEAADTPEMKSQKYEEAMEWTMMDGDYEERTRRVFRQGPVFVPMWWPRYDPSFPRTATAQPISTPAAGGGGLTLPHLPGSDFAASMVRGVESFSSGVVGNLTEFTSRVTDKTNPVPKPTYSSSRSYRSSSGGCACACACACAGCACACAGGGR
ncbi:MAG: hypothetical protein PHS96_09910 [Anaerolineales bacterium]|nr:hypothetical protein [Anaerolineales bacterium]